MSPLHIIGDGTPYAVRTLRAGITGQLGTEDETGDFYLRLVPVDGRELLPIIAKLAAILPDITMQVFERQQDGEWLMVMFEDGEEVDRTYALDLEDLYDPDCPDSVLSEMARRGLLETWQ
jgi:hypothetical protein